MKLKRAPVIIVTGGIGSGKSTVAAVFKKLGARVIDVDLFAHRLLKPGRPAWYEIIWKFCGAKLSGKYSPARHLSPKDFIDEHGRALPELPWVLNASGHIRRHRLGATVFSNPEALKSLNRILHPRLRRLLEKRIKLHSKLNSPPVVLDMAVYPERAFKTLGDVILWVRAPGGLRTQRLVEKKRMTLEEASARVRIQWKDEAFEKCADFILPNLGSDEDLIKGAEELWPRLLSRASGAKQ